MSKIIDTHCHLNIDPYIDELNNYSELFDNKNFIMNVVGTNLKDSIIASNIAKNNENVYAIIGIHPNDVKDHKLLDINQLEKIYLNNKTKVIGIGETGFDFYYDNYDYNEQLLFLDKQFDLAIKYDLTLILHIRNAHNEAINYLKSKKTLPRIVIHCFTGNIDNVKEYTKLGCYISYSGIITFKNALDLLETLKYVPLNLLLTETDSPFLTPVPFRGKINNPLYVKYVNDKVAETLNIKIDEIQDVLFENYKRCFNINL